MRAAGAGSSALLATVGGLLVAGGSTGNWMVETVRTDLGGVARTDEVVTSGLELAGALLPVGILAVVGGLAAFPARGRVRLALGVLLALLGLAALIVTGFGVAAAAGLEGELGAAAFVTGFGALAVAVAGVLALRPAGPARLPARYELDEDDPDVEWRIATESADGEEGRGVGEPRRLDHPGAQRRQEAGGGCEGRRVDEGGAQRRPSDGEEAGGGCEGRRVDEGGAQRRPSDGEEAGGGCEGRRVDEGGAQRRPSDS